MNLQTWVVLLDFLGLGAKVHDPDEFRLNKSVSQVNRRISTVDGKNLILEFSRSKYLCSIPEPVNTEVQFCVNSLSLILNKEHYELACANVSSLESHVTMRDHNLHMKGTLGRVYLNDSSPEGYLYHQKFSSTGEQALAFEIFK